MKTARPIALALLLCLLPPLLLAQAADPPMTERELGRLIADWPAVTRWFEERNRELEEGPDGSLPLALFMERDFRAFIEKRGWTVERFSYVAGRSFSLLGFVAMERRNPEIIRELDAAIAKLEGSEMPAAERRQAIEALNQTKAAMLGLSLELELDQGELILVRARFAELMRLAEED